MPTEYELGLLVGLLTGEGHFGGDGRQPQITLRMHVRHEALFHWLERTFPGGRLYGPYDHSGRRYYQWMARGAYLRDELLPLIQSRITPELDGYGYERIMKMVSQYGPQLGFRSQVETPSVVGPWASDEVDPVAHREDATATDDSAGSVAEDGEESGRPDSNSSELPVAPESALSKADSIFARMRNPNST
jgi:hypothetical protein